jgi:membrane fusion protein (multidrug efflux system)
MIGAIQRSAPLVKERCAGIVAALVLSAVLGGCSTPPPVAPPPPEVRVAAVVQRDVPIHSEWIGTTQGNINAQIRARIKGYLLTRGYTEGTQVKEGDMLFTIDRRPYETALAQARAELERTRAVLAKAERDVTRYRPLAAAGAVSQRELDTAVEAANAGRASVDAARAGVQQAELDLDWTTVRSPIGGVAGIAEAQIGDLIEPNTLLTTVSQLDPVKVQFPVSEREYLQAAARINVAVQGGERSGAAPAELELVLADGSVYPPRGKFMLPNREVDPKTGAIVVQGVFPNPDGVLRPGLYARVRAVTATKTGALLVPQRAVRELQGAYQVVVVGADDTIDMRPVEVGARVDSLWVIERGLKPGERVVVEGLQKVRQGIKVSVQVAAEAEKPTGAQGS